MLTVYLGLAMLVLVACTGAPLKRLAMIRIRHVWLLWLALADQVLIISVIPGTNATVLAVAHVASYVMAGIWLLANRLHGGRLIGLGGALNGTVITLNHGTLPASESAVRAAGQAADTGQFTNSEVLTDPHLPWLGDVFATPSWVPGHNVFSVGDVLIWLGLIVFIWRTCRAVAQHLPRHAVARPPGYEARHTARRPSAAPAPSFSPRLATVS